MVAKMARVPWTCSEHSDILSYLHLEGRNRSKSQFLPYLVIPCNSDLCVQADHIKCNPNCPPFSNKMGTIGQNVNNLPYLALSFPLKVTCYGQNVISSCVSLGGKLVQIGSKSLQYFSFNCANKGWTDVHADIWIDMTDQKWHSLA